MKISVERGDWLGQNPDLVVLVGDPYSDFIGPCPDSVAERLNSLAQGFAQGELEREVQFAESWGDGPVLNYLYYHTSTEKGFTPTENLKTFLSRALHLARETGRKKVCLLAKGPQSEGLTDQMVEGSLVGTFSFREYKKDDTDPFEELELILCLPSPEPVEVTPPPAESEEPSGTASTVAIDQSQLDDTVVESLKEDAEESQESTEEAPESEESTSEESTTADDASEGEEQKEAAEPEGLEEKHEAEEEASEAAEEEKGQESPEAEEAPAEEPSESESQAEPEPEPPAEPVLMVPDEVWETLKQQDESAVQVGRAFAEGVNLARELVARPACECTPEYLSRRAKKLSSSYKFSYQAFGPKQLEKHGYQGLVTVGQGADNTPRMIEMTYTPEQESDVHLVFLGKGVTFDSGGISIKGADKMHLMIGDMAGAAAVIGAMEVIGRLKPGFKVTGLVVSAENKPGSKSYRPGDIIRYKNGVSVHVENTDAEGRLILADGLIRAGELGATHIIDLATLTGSCARALGPSFTGVMGANRKLVNAITRAGGNHGESYWRLPLPIEYRKMLKSIHADINNVGGPDAGAITAGLFLKEFVPPRTPWAHLDIAGTFWKSKPWKYYAEGPSGTGVKTLADLALRWKEHFG